MAASALLNELLGLILPVQCPSCGEFDTSWCARCRAALPELPLRVERNVPRLARLGGESRLPVWALAPYEGGFRETILAWKDRGRVDLDRPLARAVADGARALAPLLAAICLDRRLLVIPAPSSRASRRSRGRDHLQPLARVVATTLDAKVAPVLGRHRGRDQVGQSARGRGNIRLTLAASALARASSSGPTSCLLFDDVVTTGATICAAQRVLAAAGAQVIGAFVLAATPPPAGRVRRIE